MQILKIGSLLSLAVTDRECWIQKMRVLLYCHQTAC
jgi:hypothetical protein